MHQSIPIVRDSAVALLTLKCPSRHRVYLYNDDMAHLLLTRLWDIDRMLREVGSYSRFAVALPYNKINHHIRVLSWIRLAFLLLPPHSSP